MTSQQTPRQYWMSIMAKSAASELLSLSDTEAAQQDFEVIRAPEIGLTQVRGRMGGTGSQFNLGDMTITRCVVLSAQGFYGYGYVAGRDKRHAERAAQLDAILQDEACFDRVMTHVITPLTKKLEQQQDNHTKEVAQTKVNFFTLVRGED
ncbi:phosphonate C-P lyase system protein PhnG [Marinomonas agarivorans]|nr:phosphonate C-P lyase system protein PhnG [Marinomonas agarivorans]